jgi:hypothetical protein
MTVYVCQCCGVEREFENAEIAFRAGWDTPPRFTTHVTCELCPAVCVVLGAPHEKKHKLWEREGRPATFSVEKCGVDELPDKWKGKVKNE